MVAKKMERVLLIMWFVSLVFVCIIGYREIINAVPYGLEMASKIVSENNGMDGTLYQKCSKETGPFCTEGPLLGTDFFYME